MATDDLKENNLKKKDDQNESKEYIEVEIPSHLYQTLISGSLDLQNMCRICMSSNNKVLYPLSSNENSTLGHMFTTLTAIEPLAEDGLPQNLCEECQTQVVQFYEFKLKCEKSDYTLKSVLSGEFVPKDNVPIIIEDGDEIKKGNETLEDKDYYAEARHIVQAANERNKKTLKYFTDIDSRINEVIQEKNLLKMKGSRYLCTLCAKTFLKENTFRAHVKSLHLNETKLTGLPFPCTQCKQEFDSEHDLALHSTVHATRTKANGVKCQKCNKEFKSINYTFRRHLERHMKRKRYPCDGCSKSFTEMHALRRHIRVHTGEFVERKHQCHLCDKKYVESSQLAVHLARHDGKRPWECSDCKKSFSSERLLASHRLVHTDRKPYACSYCDKRFRHESTRNTHHRTHTGEKPFICTVCGKSFIQHSNLNLHMRTHTGEQPYSCSVCSRKFKSGSSLKAHERVHTGERPYSCPVCGKRFARMYLSVHMRSHSGERPFACTLCPKKFAGKPRLVDHMRLHTGERPFECANCSLTFASKTHLVKHVKLHQAPAVKKKEFKKPTPQLHVKKPDQVIVVTPLPIAQTPPSTVILDNGMITQPNHNQQELPLNMEIPLELSGELVLQDSNSINSGVIFLDNNLQDYENDIKENLIMNNGNDSSVNNVNLVAINEEGDVSIASNLEEATIKLYQVDQSLVQIHSAGGQVTISKISNKMTSNF